jgi:hypothetical protein
MSYTGEWDCDGSAAFRIGVHEGWDSLLVQNLKQMDAAGRPGQSRGKATEIGGMGHSIPVHSVIKTI